LVEQLICNQQVIGSNPIAGSLVKRASSLCPLPLCRRYVALSRT
jgi:hypothetical protein